MVSAAAGAIPIGRIAGGIPGLGSGNAPPLGKFSPLLGLAGMAKAGAGPMMQGMAMGGGYAAGQLIAKPIQGTVGWFLNWLPENMAGFMVWGGLILYYIDWVVFGFNISAAAYLHLVFAAAAFIAFGAAMKFLSPGVLASAAGCFIALVGFVNADVRNERVLSIATVMVSFYFYFRFTAKFADRDGADFFKYLPLIAFVDVYALPMIKDQVISAVENIPGDFIINIGAGASSVMFFVFSRLLFPLWVYFPAITLYGNTRVARRVFVTILLFYFVAALPTITQAYNSKVSAISPEEKEIGQGILDRFKTNMRNILTGKFLAPSIAYAYDRAEQLYSFGEVDKEQPKIGLLLEDDPNMPKQFNLNILAAPAPSVVLRVPNPLPADAESRFINIVDISCEDKSAQPGDETLIWPTTKEALQASPIKVSYGLPVTAKCEITKSMSGGSRSVEFTVKYSYESDAELSTAFMRSDKLDALISDPDPKALGIGLRDIPLAKARYDNGPVAITWGPVELANPPVKVSTAGGKSEISVYVATEKSGGWEGEIGGIRSLVLITPPGISLDTKKADGTGDSRCMFEGSNGVYKAPKELLFRDAKKDYAPDNLRFIGEGIPFSCKVMLSKELLDKDWVGARFEAKVNYLFSTKKTVSFKVVGKEMPESERCKETQGTWDEAKKCDCGKDRKWQSLTDGCVPPLQAAPTQPGTPAPAQTFKQLCESTGGSSPDGKSCDCKDSAKKYIPSKGCLTKLPSEVLGCSSRMMTDTEGGYELYKSNCEAAASGGKWHEIKKSRIRLQTEIIRTEGCCACPAGKTWETAGNTGCIAGTAPQAQATV